MFGPEDQQEAVYEDVSDLVISAADGYNVCIMAYGQTGSGKTYTMQGTQERPGINMRALHELFQLAESRSDSMRMTVQASILEIYNDSIFDLLSASPRESGSKLDIKELKCGPLFCLCSPSASAAAALPRFSFASWWPVVWFAALERCVQSPVSRVALSKRLWREYVWRRGS